MHLYPYLCTFLCLLGLHRNLCRACSLQLCAAAVLAIQCGLDEENVDRTLGEKDSRRAVELALKLEAKVFLSQPVMESATARKWLGNFTPKMLHLADKEVYEEGLSSGSLTVAYAVLLLLLAVQLPLVLLIAIAPPLERIFRRKLGRFYLLSAPIVKFGIAFTFDLAFAAILTFTHHTGFGGNIGILVLLWSSASVLWEVRA